MCQIRKISARRRRQLRLTRGGSEKKKKKKKKKKKNLGDTPYVTMYQMAQDQKTVHSLTVRQGWLGSLSGKKKTGTGVRAEGHEGGVARSASRTEGSTIWRVGGRFLASRQVPGVSRPRRLGLSRDGRFAEEVRTPMTEFDFRFSYHAVGSIPFLKSIRMVDRSEPRVTAPRGGTHAPQEGKKIQGRSGLLLLRRRKSCDFGGFTEMNAVPTAF